MSLLAYALAIAIAAAAPAPAPAPADGSVHYLCQASAKWGKYHQAVLSRLVFPPYATPTELSYQVSWSELGKGVAELVARWTIKDPAVAPLPETSSLYFDFYMERPLRGGTVLLVSPEETVPIKVRKPVVKFIGGGFHSEAVSIGDPAMLATIMRGGPWRYVAVDGRGRVAAEGPLNLPSWEEMSSRFTSLKAALDKKIAAPNTACVAIPTDTAEEEI